MSGDKTGKYTVGSRIKLTQTTVKYFVVASSSYNSGTATTTVSITGGTDYTLANAAISANYHSYAVNPQGYPAWFSFATGATGFSSLTSDVGMFAVNGRMCFVIPNILGTSNATTFTWIAPIAAGGSVNILSVAAATDSGSTKIGRAIIAAGSTTVTMTLGSVSGSTMLLNGSPFTNSGSKGCVGATVLTYEL